MSEGDVRVVIGSDADTVVARQKGRQLALEIGLSRTEATFVATAISEIARNIVSHAGAGEIVIGRLRKHGRTGLVVVARDEGPGIADVEAVMRNEFDSEAGLGVGLWGARRLMDEIVVSSQPGEGTTVTMTKWSTDDRIDLAFGNHLNPGDERGE